jgi:hypothetical protein
MKLISSALFSLMLVALSSAATIDVTMSKTQLPPTQDPVTGAGLGSGSGTLAPLGVMSWSDRGFLDSTGTAFNGTFTMTFANGTLFGNLGETIDRSGGLTAILIDQRMDVTGGTGAFLWYNGLITANGTINAITNVPALFSGAGTLNTAPEPAGIALLPIGLLCLVAYRKFSAQV